MAIFTMITMTYYLTFSQGAGFKAAREQAKCRKDSAGLGPSTAILFIPCTRTCSEQRSEGDRVKSFLLTAKPAVSNYF